jgi:hypothetical protein
MGRLSTRDRLYSSDNSSSVSSDLPKVYDNIRASRLSAMTVRRLDGGAVTKLDSVGSFRENDSRSVAATTANYTHNYTRKHNISCSYSLGTYMCNTCTSGEHLVLHRDSQKVNVRDLVPQAFVLADQNFLPAVPVGGGGGLSKNI